MPGRHKVAFVVKNDFTTHLKLRNDGRSADLKEQISLNDSVTRINGRLEIAGRHTRKPFPEDVTGNSNTIFYNEIGNRLSLPSKRQTMAYPDFYNYLRAGISLVVQK